MKNWQLAALLADEAELRQRYIPVDIVKRGLEDADPEKVLEALRQSNKQYYIYEGAHLRLYGLPHEQVDESTEPIAIYDAYLRFGATAITEVIDYGSFPLRRLTDANK